MLASYEMAVVKFGSNCLVDDEGLDQRRIDAYAKQLQQMRWQHNLNLAVVSSGAVAAGKRRYVHDLKWLPKHVEQIDDQVLAAAGNPQVAQAWAQAFKPYYVATGEVLATHHELKDKDEKKALQQSIQRMREQLVVPVVNANDALEQKELRRLKEAGDNDFLAADLAVGIGAKVLLLCTDQDGFMVDGTVQGRVSVSDIGSLQHHIYESNDEGTGGMGTKLAAAAVAASAGIEAYIGNAGANYAQILAGEIGTQVVQ